MLGPPMFLHIAFKISFENKNLTLTEHNTSSAESVLFILK